MIAVSLTLSVQEVSVLALFGSPVLVVLLALAAVICAAVLAFGLLELRLAWWILRDDPDSVLDAPNEGPIELVGVAEADDRTLRAPFTETECLAYEYEVEREQHTKNGRTWDQIASGRDAVPFRLTDDTGSVLVEPPGADIRLEREARLTVRGGERPPEQVLRFIESDDRVSDQNTSVDLRLFELKTGKDQRFTEKRLDVGETVHVLGTARFDTTASQKVGQVNAVVGMDPQVLELGRFRWYLHRLLGTPFLISDTDERGTAKRIGLVGVLATTGGILGFGLLSLVVF